MRIVSKFHDYYDSIMAHGQDQSTVYVRTPRTITDKDLLKLVGVDRRDWASIYSEPYYKQKQGPKLVHPYMPSEVYLKNTKYTKLTFDSEIILFCGKAYRSVVVTAQLPSTNTYTVGERVTDCFYSYPELEQFLHSCGKLVQDIYRKNFSDRELDRARKLEAFLSGQGTDELEEALIKSRVVTARFVYDDPARKYVWMENQPLKDVRFFKVKDPYTAFQELDMYISGVLGQQTAEVINISDKDRIYQHGFDGYSFRKLPSEKGRKKQ